MDATVRGFIAEQLRRLETADYVEERDLLAELISDPDNGFISIAQELGRTFATIMAREFQLALRGGGSSLSALARVAARVLSIVLLSIVLQMVFVTTVPWIHRLIVAQRFADAPSPCGAPMGRFATVAAAAATPAACVRVFLPFAGAGAPAARAGLAAHPTWAPRVAQVSYVATPAGAYSVEPQLAGGVASPTGLSAPPTASPSTAPSAPTETPRVAAPSVTPSALAPTVVPVVGSATPSLAPSATPTFAPLVAAAPTALLSAPTFSPPVEPSPAPSATPTPSATATPPLVPTPTATATPVVPTPTPEQPDATLEPSPTATVTPSATVAPSATSTPSATVESTATIMPTTTLTPSPVAYPSPSDTPTTPSPTPGVCVAQPRDMVLLIDRSASIRDAGAHEQMLAAAKTFLLDDHDGDDQIALVTFNDTAVTLAGLSPAERHEQVAEQLRTITIEGKTNIAAGLSAALELLANRRAEAAPVIVLLTDGLNSPEYADPLPVADQAYAQGVRVLAAHLGHTNGLRLLEQLTTTAADTRSASGVEQLDEVFTEIAATLACDASAQGRPSTSSSAP